MLQSFGDRCFAVAAPTLWNVFLVTICKSETLKHFKLSLKTYLFQLAFNEQDGILDFNYNLLLCQQCSALLIILLYVKKHNKSTKLL